jgi:hypothetical protein
VAWGCTRGALELFLVLEAFLELWAFFLATARVFLGFGATYRTHSVRG